jgi:hypothetical protein
MNGRILRGGCLCGAVRYEIEAPIGLVEHCHCSRCRKAHGAAFSTNTVVESTKLKVLGGSESLATYASSPNRLRCFCGTCGSPLFIRRLDRPDVMVVALGSMDDDPGQRPERHVFVASKAPWYEMGADLPAYGIYPGHEPA